MSELHLLVVFDTEARTFRVADLGEMPVDSDEAVWDANTDEWRTPTEAEVETYIGAEGLLIDALANINEEKEVNHD